MHQLSSAAMLFLAKHVELHTDDSDEFWLRIPFKHRAACLTRPEPTTLQTISEPRKLFHRFRFTDTVD
jgi:hypothetical protein